MKTTKQLIFAFILFFAVTSVMAQSENSENSQKVSPVKSQTENSANDASTSKPGVRLPSTAGKPEKPAAMAIPQNYKNDKGEMGRSSMTRQGMMGTTTGDASKNNSESFGSGSAPSPNDTKNAKANKVPVESGNKS